MPQQGTNRKKGTGSIRERSAGHYELRYYDKATQRQAVRTFVAPRAERGASIRAARAALAALVADVEAGRYVYSRDAKAEPALDPEPQLGTRTVGEVLDDGRRIASRLAGPTRPGTVTASALSASRLQSATWPCRLLVRATWTGSTLSWRAEGMSQAGVVHHHRVSRAALNQAKKWEWVDRNVALNATVTTPAPPNFTCQALSKQKLSYCALSKGPHPTLDRSSSSRS